MPLHLVVPPEKESVRVCERERESRFVLLRERERVALS